MSEAVLTCTHNQCFEQKKEKHHNFSFENDLFYSREKLQYITWACFRNGKLLTYTCSWRWLLLGQNKMNDEYSELDKP